MLHDIKVGLWCAISVTRIIGFIFFLDATNSEGKIGQILTPLAENLSGVQKRKKKNRFFQQDGGTTQTTNKSVTALHNTFGD
jgi:hypothetical protein